MSERLEHWKATKGVRRNVGWLAILLGVSGGFGVITGLLLLAVRGGAQASDVPLSLPLWMILIGVAVLLCARGLARAQPWARWGAIAILAAACAEPFQRLVRGIELGDALLSMAIPLTVIVYLLLPSTGRFFASARGSQAKGLPG